MPTEVAEKRDLLPSLDQIREAQKLIYSIMQPTPQLSWPLLNQRLGTEVWIKHENHSPIGAFKARTAIVYVAELLKREKNLRGLITATRGNHGQSVALAGQRFGIPATIVVPFGNSTEKNAAMRGQGAKLIEFGTDFQESREYAARLAEEQGLHMVQPYHRDIVKGVASYWMELFEAVPELDLVYAPIGMGSGICAGCAVRNGLGLKTKIMAVVADGAPAYALSLEQGRTVEAAVTTNIADGMACRTPDEDALQIMRENVERVVRVSDDEIRQAMKIYFTDTHNLVEGAGAAALAAALKEKNLLDGKRVGVIATGGNVDYKIFAKVLLADEKGQEGH
ncbi:MAG TPA: threonine dehydratase [Terriglobales bacterium]|jgi:threonine dehydratase|nr:threonine dehydratase [Terriglobales bacterium]